MRFPGRSEDLLRFQVNLLSLAQRHYESLQDEQWIETLTKYQLELYRAGYTEFTHKLLQTIGEVSVCPTPEYREKSLFLLTVFLNDVVKEADDELLQALSWTFLRWLHFEQELLACSEYVCTLLAVIPEQLLARGKFAQFTLWLELLQQINSSQLNRPPAVRAIVARLLNTLIGRFLDRKISLNLSSDVGPESESAYLVDYFAAGRVSMLIEELYHSGDKDRRLALVEVLGQLGESVASRLLEHLEEDASWYMVRNALQVISHFESKKHLGLVLPFLKYPDLRVQQQVIDFICKLEDEEKIRQLINALDVCHDRLKSNVVKILSGFATPEIELALIRLLAAGSNIEQWSRDHLLQAICEALKAYPTVRVTEALKRLVADCNAEKRKGDPVATAARQTIEYLTRS